MFIIYLDFVRCLVNHLSPNELIRRQSGAYLVQDSTAMSNYQYSSTEEFCLSQEDVEEMAQRLQVDTSIILFNAIRLRDICNMFLLEHEYYRRDVLEQAYVEMEEPQLQSKQMVTALEFFLQMDGKIRVMN